MRSIVDLRASELSVREQLTAEIRNAAAVVFVISKAMSGREWLRFELDEALQEAQARSQLFLLPVVIDESGVDSWPQRLRDIDAERASEGRLDARFVNHVKNVVRAFEHAGESARPVESDSEAGDEARAADPRQRDFALVVGIGR